MEVKGFVEILAIGCLCSHYQVQGPYGQLPTEPLSKDYRRQTAMGSYNQPVTGPVVDELAARRARNAGNR